MLRRLLVLETDSVQKKVQKLGFNIEDGFKHGVEFVGEVESDKLDIVIYDGGIDVDKVSLTKLQVAELRKFLSDIHNWSYGDAVIEAPKI